MHCLAFRFIIAILTFIVGITAAVMWLSHNDPSSQMLCHSGLAPTETRSEKIVEPISVRRHPDFIYLSEALEVFAAGDAESEKNTFHVAKVGRYPDATWVYWKENEKLFLLTAREVLNLAHAKRFNKGVGPLSEYYGHSQSFLSASERREVMESCLAGDEFIISRSERRQRTPQSNKGMQPTANKLASH